MKHGGKVFSLSGTEASKYEKPVRGTSFINGVPLITMIDIGATHSIISTDCVKRLGIVVSAMNDNMAIDTPTNRPVTSYLVCFNCLLTIYGREFGIDLVCLPLSQLHVILGMNWLEFNRMYINCYSKTLLFPKLVEKKGLQLIFSRNIKEFMKD